MERFAFSNFQPAAVRCDLGVHYPTVEHAYQAMKTLERPARERVAALARPGQVCDTRSRQGPRGDVTRRF